LPTELHDRLRCAADERHVSVNFLIVKALEDYLDRLIPIDEVELTRPRAGS
jgi:predicted HicB family RNase H-like nuclease